MGAVAIRTIEILRSVWTWIVDPTKGRRDRAERQARELERLEKMRGGLDEIWALLRYEVLNASQCEVVRQLGEAAMDGGRFETRHLEMYRQRLATALVSVGGAGLENSREPVAHARAALRGFWYAAGHTLKWRHPEFCDGTALRGSLPER